MSEPYFTNAITGKKIGELLDVQIVMPDGTTRTETFSAKKMLNIMATIGMDRMGFRHETTFNNQ